MLRENVFAVVGFVVGFVLCVFGLWYGGHEIFVRKQGQELLLVLAILLGICGGLAGSILDIKRREVRR